MRLGRRDRLRGLDAGLPRHGHRHGQDAAERTPRPATGASTSSSRASRSRRRCTSARHEPRSTTSTRAASCRSSPAGTGLYVRAALDDMEFPAGEQQRRSAGALRGARRREGRRGAPRAARFARPGLGRAHPPQQRPARRARARDAATRASATPSSSRGSRRRTSVYDARFIGLDVERERALRAHRRSGSTRCSPTGLLGEVGALLERGLPRRAHRVAGHRLQGARAGDRGRRSISTRRSQAIKQATRRYAKRQLTWFRADPRISWIDVTDRQPRQPGGAMRRRLGTLPT